MVREIKWFEESVLDACVDWHVRNRRIVNEAIRCVNVWQIERFDDESDFAQWQFDELDIMRPRTRGPIRMGPWAVVVCSWR